jgi:hypothetical protein
VALGAAVVAQNHMDFSYLSGVPGGQTGSLGTATRTKALLAARTETADTDQFMQTSQYPDFTNDGYRLAVPSTGPVSHRISGTVQAMNVDGSAFVEWRVFGTLHYWETGPVNRNDLVFVRTRVKAGGDSANYKISAAQVLDSDGTLLLRIRVRTTTTATVYWSADLDILRLATTGYDNVDPGELQSISPNVVFATASETLTAGDLVNIWSDAGTTKIRKADAVLGYPADGFVQENYSATDACQCFTNGLNPYKSGLTVGSQYLGQAGAATSVYPGAGNQLIQPVGWATSSTNLAFAYSPPTVVTLGQALALARGFAMP